MPQLAHLIVGLGNPGEDYARTRHNIGFRAVEALAEKTHCPAWKKKFKAQATGTQDFLFLKPQTFMNLSGEAVGEAMRFYQMSASQIIVFHDDLDLATGQVKVKQGGGSGGHNGLKSLDAHIGADYWRVRLGIGRPLTEQGLPVKGEPVTSYVLSPFSRTDQTWLEPLLDRLSGSFGLLQRGDYVAYGRSAS